MEAKIRGSASSPKNGPPYRDIPPIPERKPRSKPRYTIVLISESGASRQLELTSFRLRMGIVAAVGVLVLLVVAAAGSAGIFSGKGHMSGQAGELAKTVNILQEQLKEKQAALTVQERRIKELQELPTLTTVPSRSPVSEGPKKGLTEEAEPGTDGPLTGLHEPRYETGTASGLGSRAERSDDSLESRQEAAVKPERPSGLGESGAAPSAATVPMIVFDAQGLTAAVPNAKGKDVLSFRLTKDHTDMRFAGYLFVFVEVIDSQGQSQIYAYPDSARLGEGNIPSDCREGQSVSFKYNTRVELPLPNLEAGTGASLASVSILLYGEGGEIVYQRGFERKELKIVHAKGKGEGTGARAGARRQAL